MIRRGNELHLTLRLQALADLVPQGKTIADVGCDHGFLDIYLVQSGRVPGALAMDVRKGPLSAAAEHITEFGLEQRIRTVLSDGLEKYEAGSAEVLVCAGMGGPLMQRILTAYPEKTDSFEELILQPQSELYEFRVFLRRQGYIISEERILTEEGKYYFPMRVTKRAGGLVGAANRTEARRAEQQEAEIDTELQNRYGGQLLKARDPILHQYLLWQTGLYEGIEKEIRGQARDSRRLAEVERELEALHRALSLWK